MQLRQGDVLLVRQNTRQARYEDRQRVTDGVIAFGESTGHAHRVIDGDVSLDRYERLNVVSDGAATLVHDEHATITIPEGTYRVIRQREQGVDDIHDVYD